MGGMFIKKALFTIMIIAKVMKMIIIFMLIIAVIPEHYIMPFVPLCEKLKMNFPPPLHYGNT